MVWKKCDDQCQAVLWKSLTPGFIWLYYLSIGDQTLCDGSSYSRWWPIHAAVIDRGFIVLCCKGPCVHFYLVSVQTFIMLHRLLTVTWRRSVWPSHDSSLCLTRRCWRFWVRPVTHTPSRPTSSASSTTPRTSASTRSSMSLSCPSSPAKERSLR